MMHQQLNRITICRLSTFAVRERGSQKLVITPDGVTQHRRREWCSTAPFSRPSSAVSVGARCLRSATIGDLAEAENFNPSYVSPVLHTMLLMPEIVEVIVAGWEPDGLTMLMAMNVFSASWALQRSL
jgi:hypothetical protein